MVDNFPLLRHSEEMLVGIASFLIILGLLYLLLSPKPQVVHKEVANGHPAYGPSELPPLPKNQLPLSPDGQTPLPPGVPATEMQLLQQPAYPALRTYQG